MSRVPYLKDFISLALIIVDKIRNVLRQFVIIPPVFLHIMLEIFLNNRVHKSITFSGDAEELQCTFPGDVCQPV